jgi:hypothetical protein
LSTNGSSAAGMKYPVFTGDIFCCGRVRERGNYLFQCSSVMLGHDPRRSRAARYARILCVYTLFQLRHCQRLKPLQGGVGGCIRASVQEKLFSLTASTALRAPSLRSKKNGSLTSTTNVPRPTSSKLTPTRPTHRQSARQRLAILVSRDNSHLERRPATRCETTLESLLVYSATCFFSFFFVFISSFFSSHSFHISGATITSDAVY